MNIAEIRKKAREGKAEQKISGSEPLTDGSVPREEVSAGAALSPLARPTLSPLATAADTAVRELSAADSIEARELLAVGDDRLDELFSWVPEAEELQLESSATAAAGKRVDAMARRWLAFSLGREDYALDISMIREILKPREITEIPRVPEFLLGIISLRGNIIPIFDLKRRLGLGVATIDQDSRIIVCQEGDRLAGLLIDRITQVTSIQEEEIESPPAIFSGRDRALLAGVGRVQGNVLILLNITNVLTIDSNGL